MEPPQFRQTLTKLKNRLRQLNLCKGYTTIGTRRISNSIFFVLLSFGLLIYIFLALCFGLEHNLDLNVVSGALCVACGDFQIFLICTCWTIHRSLIEQSLNDLEAIVNKRKLDQILHGIFLLFFHLFALFLRNPFSTEKNLRTFCY